MNVDFYSVRTLHSCSFLDESFIGNSWSYWVYQALLLQVTGAVLSPAAMSVGVVVGVVAACSVCFFIASVLVELLTAALLRKCKNCHKSQSADSLLHQVKVQPEVKVQRMFTLCKH